MAADNIYGTITKTYYSEARKGLDYTTKKLQDAIGIDPEKFEVIGQYTVELEGSGTISDNTIQVVEGGVVPAGQTGVAEDGMTVTFKYRGKPTTYNITVTNFLKTSDKNKIRYVKDNKKNLSTGLNSNGEVAFNTRFGNSYSYEFDYDNAFLDRYYYNVSSTLKTISGDHIEIANDTYTCSLIQRKLDVAYTTNGATCTDGAACSESRVGKGTVSMETVSKYESDRWGKGDKFKLTATPDTTTAIDTHTYEFDHWEISGDTTNTNYSTSATITETITWESGKRTYTAVFKAVPKNDTINVTYTGTFYEDFA